MLMQERTWLGFLEYRAISEIVGIGLGDAPFQTVTRRLHRPVNSDCSSGLRSLIHLHRYDAFPEDGD